MIKRNTQRKKRLKKKCHPNYVGFAFQLLANVTITPIMDSIKPPVSHSFHHRVFRLLFGTHRTYVFSASWILFSIKFFLHKKNITIRRVCFRSWRTRATYALKSELKLFVKFCFIWFVSPNRICFATWRKNETCTMVAGAIANLFTCSKYEQKGNIFAK